MWHYKREILPSFFVPPPAEPISTSFLSLLATCLCGRAAHCHLLVALLCPNDQSEEDLHWARIDNSQIHTCCEENLQCAGQLASVLPVSQPQVQNIHTFLAQRLANRNAICSYLPQQESKTEDRK